jgi:putative transcriptional regulator
MSEFLKGQFLIAGYRLRDDNFFKSVVLIVEHNAQGAMGVIVNRPTDETVSETLEGHFELPETGDVIYEGGPVEPAALFIVHDGGIDEPDEPEIVPGIFVASSAETFERVVRGAAADEPVRYRVFKGCAGWGSGQLEGEMSRGDWLAHPASEEFVFHDDPYAVWEELVNSVYAKHRLLPHPEVSPEWN